MICACKTTGAALVHKSPFECSTCSPYTLPPFPPPSLPPSLGAHYVQVGRAHPRYHKLLECVARSNRVDRCVSVRWLDIMATELKWDVVVSDVVSPQGTLQDGIFEELSLIRCRLLPVCNRCTSMCAALYAHTALCASRRCRLLSQSYRSRHCHGDSVMVVAAVSVQAMAIASPSLRALTSVLGTVPTLGLDVARFMNQYQVPRQTLSCSCSTFFIHLPPSLSFSLSLHSSLPLPHSLHSSLSPALLSLPPSPFLSPSPFLPPSCIFSLGKVSHCIDLDLGTLPHSVLAESCELFRVDLNSLGDDSLKVSVERERALVTLNISWISLFMALSTTIIIIMHS